jgi:hypothetical protein
MKLLSALTILMIINPSFAEPAKLVAFATLDKTFKAEQIKNIFVDGNQKVDMIELNDGNIFYDTEIKNTTIMFPDMTKWTLPTDINNNGNLLDWNKPNIKKPHQLNIDWGKVIDGFDGSLMGPGGISAVGGDATGGG